jgi:integrase
MFSNGLSRVMLPSFAVDVLREHRVHQTLMRDKLGSVWKENGLVFCNKFGGVIESNNLRATFRRLLIDAELPSIRFHDLRHSAASILLGMGVNPKVIQELLGHSHISITLHVYSHTLPSMQRDAMDKLDNFFGE